MQCLSVPCSAHNLKPLYLVVLTIIAAATYATANRDQTVSRVTPVLYFLDFLEQLPGGVCFRR